MKTLPITAKDWVLAQYQKEQLQKTMQPFYDAFEPKVTRVYRVPDRKPRGLD